MNDLWTEKRKNAPPLMQEKEKSFLDLDPGEGRGLRSQAPIFGTEFRKEKGKLFL